jgi:hypothetical protein
MKNRERLITVATAIGLAVIFTSCDKFDNEAVNKSLETAECNQQDPESSASCDFTATLTDAEIATLMHMREEEKVARDVYNKFSELYNIPVFRNIAISEQRHMDAVLNLIIGYGLTDPVAGKGPGEFTPAFQSLYDELIAKGTNLTEALKVGVAIEELDITDLEEAIESTEVATLLRVYNNLLAASKNHLTAFSSKL